MSKTKKQHYLPQFYLRNFADEEERLLFVDSTINKPYVDTNVKDAAQGSYYYDFFGDGDKQSLEKMFGLLETEFASDFRTIMESAKNRKLLSEESKGSIVKFIKFQFLRSDWMRGKIPDGFLQEHFEPEYVDKADKLLHAYIISESMFTEMLDYLYKYDMEILETHESLEIFTSSFPLFFNYVGELQELFEILTNGDVDNMPSLNSNLFLPLSSRYAIHIFDPQKPKGFDEKNWVSSFITSGIAWANKRIYFRSHPNSIKVYPMLKRLLNRRSIYFDLEKK